jgi:glycosyltransferase involved in cell wall biosynthesis
LLPKIEDYQVRKACPERVTGGKRAESTRLPIRRGLVTVITVAFNSERTIERTIDSIKSQTYPNIEYLVIDGGSKDDTVVLLERRDGDIDRWISEPDLGISDAFNKGIALSSGEYLAFLNSDDWLEPDHLRCAVDALQDSSIDFVFGDLWLHSPDGREQHVFIGEPNYAARIAHHMPFLNHPTVLCRRAAFDKIGLFDPALRTAMDYDWFLRLHRMGGRGTYVPRLVSHMTLEGQSDRNFGAGLREVRIVSMRHGYPGWLAWPRFAFRLTKGTLRRRLQGHLPARLYEALRKAINTNYRSRTDRTC